MKRLRELYEKAITEWGTHHPGLVCVLLPMHTTSYISPSPPLTPSFHLYTLRSPPSPAPIFPPSSPLSCLTHNPDLWLDYITSELHIPSGDVTRVSQLHWRAIKTLSATHTAEFISKITLFSNQLSS